MVKLPERYANDGGEKNSGESYHWRQGWFRMHAANAPSCTVHSTQCGLIETQVLYCLLLNVFTMPLIFSPLFLCTMLHVGWSHVGFLQCFNITVSRYSCIFVVCSSEIVRSDFKTLFYDCLDHIWVIWFSTCTLFYHFSSQPHDQAFLISMILRFTVCIGGARATVLSAYFQVLCWKGGLKDHSCHEHSLKQGRDA